jgi:predicted nucleotidyltransferase
MKQTDLEHIKQRVIPILKDAGITHAAIYGSVARREQTNKSDVDILVDLPEDMSLFDVVDLEFKLEEAVQRKVD